MKNIKAISLLVIILVVGMAATVQKSYFEFSDSQFHVGQIKRVNIVFGYNSAGPLKNDHNDSIFNSIATLLQSHPGMKLDLGSHTDYRGGDRYNERLSEMRSRSAKHYLVGSYGVDTAQLSITGYGERKPTVIDHMFHQMLPKKHQEIFPVGTILDEVTIKKMTKENMEIAHQYNRRMELEIVKVGR